MILEAFAVSVLPRVLLAGVLAAIAAGIMGSYVVVRSMSAVTGGLAHAAFGGVGLGYVLGFHPMLGAAGFGVLCGIGIGWAYRNLRATLDTSISMIWAAGMALGVVLAALAPDQAPALEGFLFGSIARASWTYIAIATAVDLGLVAMTFFLFDAFEAISFDEEFAEVMGLPVDRLLLVLLTAISLTVITLIRVVGVILAIALMTAPAATARQWTETLHGTMALATALACTCTVLGIGVAHLASTGASISVPAGPVIALTTLLAYGVSSAAIAIRR